MWWCLKSNFRGETIFGHSWCVDTFATGNGVAFVHVLWVTDPSCLPNSCSDGKTAWDCHIGPPPVVPVPMASCAVYIWPGLSTHLCVYMAGSQLGWFKVDPRPGQAGRTRDSNGGKRVNRKWTKILCISHDSSPCKALQKQFNHLLVNSTK